MPRSFYSYRLRREVPLLNDDEHDRVMKHFSNYIEAIKEYQETHNCSISEAREKNPKGQSALALYEEMTGVCLEHPEQLYAVRLSNYGRPCPDCDKLFRTPSAQFCVECGFQLPEGEVAGMAAHQD